MNAAAKYKIERLGRELKLWKYGASHSQLVLMGPKTHEHQDRIVILIKGVEAISLPTSFHCEEIRWDEEEPSLIEFEGKDGIHHVRGLAIYLDRDQLEYDGPSKLINQSMF